MSLLQNYNNSLEILQPKSLVKDLQLKAKKELKEKLLLKKKFFPKRMKQQMYYLQNQLLQMHQRVKEF
jgi:hypothetical protein